MPVWLHCNYLIHSVNKEITYKNCLHAGNQWRSQTSVDGGAMLTR